MFICRFCNKESKKPNSNSLNNHERLCSLNPNRQFTIFSDSEFKKLNKKSPSNQFIKAKQLGLPKPEVSSSTRNKISKANTNNSKRIWTEERRKYHSIVMKEAVEKYPESYTSSNRGRTKQIEYDGIKFQGTWELEFYKYCKNNEINIVRSNEYFLYEWNGIRKYFPDFYLKDFDTYVEIKGYETERDKAKWSSFPRKLLIVKKEDIQKIKKNCWKLPI